MNDYTTPGTYAMTTTPRVGDVAYLHGTADRVAAVTVDAEGVTTVTTWNGRSVRGTAFAVRASCSKTAANAKKKNDRRSDASASAEPPAPDRLTVRGRSSCIRGRNALES